MVGVLATGSHGGPKRTSLILLSPLAALNVGMIGAILDKRENPTRYARGKENWMPEKMKLAYGLLVSELLGWK